MDDSGSGRGRNAEERKFDKMMTAAIRDVQQGKMALDALFQIARSRDEDTIRYCLQRMSSAGYDRAEEILIARLLQHSGIVQRFIDHLHALEPQFAENLARIFKQADSGLDMKIAARLESKDLNVVMRSLDLLDAIGEDPGLLPFLFSLLNLDAPQVQSKAAKLIQKLDTDFIYTRHLLKHPLPRVRANALQAIIDRADERGLEFLQLCASDPDNRVRSLVALGLCLVGNPEGLETLTSMAHHPDAATRRSGAWALGICGMEHQLPVLEKLEETDPDERVRQLARDSRAKVRSRVGF